MPTRCLYTFWSTRRFTVEDVVDGDPRAQEARLAAPHTGADLDQLRHVHDDLIRVIDDTQASASTG
jgi:hypothetical protein